MKKRWKIIAVVVGLVALPAPSVDAGTELQQVRVALARREAVDNLPYFIGVGMGFFKEVGIDLQPWYFRGDDEVVRAVTSRAVDLAGSAAPASIFSAVSRGEPIRILSGNVVPLVGIVWVVRAESAFRSVQDLRGKRVGFSSPGSVVHTAIQAVLRAEALEGSVKLVQAGTPVDNWAAVRGGFLDAGWHMTPAVHALLVQGEARIIINGSDYVKNYMQSSVAAMRTVIEQEPEMIRNFLRARARAVRFIWESPPRTVALWTGELRLPAEAVRLAYRQLPKTAFPVGTPRMEELDGTMQEAMRSGTLKEPLDIQQLLDLRFLP